MSKWPEGINPDLPKPREWKPMVFIAAKGDREDWFNEYYQVLVQHRGDCRCLMITNADQSARIDWREWMRIKNQLVGESAVGYQIFPPESDAVDPSNAFFLWCFPKAMLPKECGMNGPRHFTPEESIAPQRSGEK